MAPQILRLTKQKEKSGQTAKRGQWRKGDSGGSLERPCTNGGNWCGGESRHENIRTGNSAATTPVTSPYSSPN